MWEKCLNCESTCCSRLDVACPLFITEEDFSKIKNSGFDVKDFNKKFPCICLDSNNKCKIYKARPVDCQLFPFDVHKVNGEFYWIIWKIDCSIVLGTDYEKYLIYFEKEIIPKFKKYLNEYESFRSGELTKLLGFKILRKIKS